MMCIFFTFFVISSALLSVTEADFKCFSAKLSHLGDNIDVFFGDNKEANCRTGQKAFIDSLQRAIDQCSVPVSTDSMKSLIKELCDPGSELYEIFQQNGDCVHFNRKHHTNNCKIGANIDLNLPAKEACLKMKRDYFTCSANVIGRNCGGERVEKALLRVYETSDSLTSGMCDEIASLHSSSLTTEPTTTLSSSVVLVLVHNDSSTTSRLSLSSTTKASPAGYLSWFAVAVVAFIGFTV